MQLIKTNKNQKGFTLIELMVSIALFSIVLTAALGSILTIADANKKSRSLMSVMSNLNFAVDSITRSFKSGEITPDSNPVTYSNKCLETREINYSIETGYQRRSVKYCFVEIGTDPNKKGKITKEINGNGTAVDLTSPDVDIDYLKFDVAGYERGKQPLASIILEGTVQVSPKISSKFSIQTSVSQRKLNI